MRYFKYIYRSAIAIISIYASAFMFYQQIYNSRKIVIVIIKYFVIKYETRSFVNLIRIYIYVYIYYCICILNSYMYVYTYSILHSYAHAFALQFLYFLNSCLNYKLKSRNTNYIRKRNMAAYVYSA